MAGRRRARNRPQPRAGDAGASGTGATQNPYFAAARRRL